MLGDGAEVTVSQHAATALGELGRGTYVWIVDVSTMVPVLCTVETVMHVRMYREADGAVQVMCTYILLSDKSQMMSVAFLVQADCVDSRTMFCAICLSCIAPSQHTISWPCSHKVHLACIFRNPHNADRNCFTCRTPAAPGASEFVRVQAARLNYNVFAISSSEFEFVRVGPQQSIVASGRPRVPSHILPLCCPRLEFNGRIFVHSTDRRMRWSPQSRDGVRWVNCWSCLSCNLDVSERALYTEFRIQGFRSAFCPQHGMLTFVIDMQDGSRRLSCSALVQDDNPDNDDTPHFIDCSHVYQSSTSRPLSESQEPPVDRLDDDRLDMIDNDINQVLEDLDMIDNDINQNDVQNTDAEMIALAEISERAEIFEEIVALAMVDVNRQFDE